MRRGMRALSAVAIVALAAGAAFASQLVEVSNTAQDPLFEGPGSPATFYSPMATAWGALWMNTGSGPFQYDIDQDINVQLNVQAPAPYGWTTIATYLVSDGTAKGDETTWNSPDQFNYPGMFTCGNSLEAGDPTIPGTGSGPGPSDQYNMELYIWTGNYTTYAAAQAAAAAHTAGAYIADSGVFNETVPLAIGPVEAQPLIGMPATILSQHPVTLVPGDANGDGRVGINDLTIVLSDFDRSVGLGAWAQGDFVGDATVDINDLTIVLSNFGHTSSAGLLNAVPEPASIVPLACCGLALLAGARRRRRRRRAAC